MRCVERTARSRVFITKRKTNEEFVAELLALHPTIEPLDKYQTALTRIKCCCKVCGYIWSPKPNDLLSGHGCPNCAGVKRKSHDDFIREINDIHPNICVLDTYINSKTKVKCLCLNDGHVWYMSPDDLLHGHGCSVCHGGVPDNMDSFLSKLHKKTHDITVSGQYVNSQTKLQCKCNKCGHEWMSKPNSLLNGCGCPKCKASHGERRISKYLDDHHIAYISQHKFDDCRYIRPLLFDFYLPQYNTVIEYQGEQHFHKLWYDYIHHYDDTIATNHYELAQLRDEIKRKFCESNNIQLIEIPYTELKSIEKFLDNIFT